MDTERMEEMRKKYLVSRAEHALLDTASQDVADPRDLEDLGDGEAERLVIVAGRRLDHLVESLIEGANSDLVLGAGVRHRDTLPPGHVLA